MPQLAHNQGLVIAAYGLAIGGLLLGPEHALPPRWLGARRPPWFLGKVVYAPILAVVLLAMAHLLPLGEMVEPLVTLQLVGTVVREKYHLILLILSFAYLSISLDMEGFFAWCAYRIAVRAQGSGKRLLIELFLLCSVLTFFTSNDIVIISMTPIILHLGAQAGIRNLVPLLISQFIAANTASMGLYIGSPTNIVLGDATSMTFVDFFVWMAAPTVVATATTLVMLLVLFHWLPMRGNRIAATYVPPKAEACPPATAPMWAKVGIFAACLLLLTISSFIQVPLWLICLGTAIAMLLFDLRLLRRRGRSPLQFLSQVNDRMPWAIAPFVTAFFVIVALLSQTGVTRRVCDGLLALGHGSSLKLTLLFGYASAAAVNLLNDIPSTVFWADMIPNLRASLPPDQFRAVLLALIVGVNPGCYLTLIGALAGLMWINIIRTYPSSQGHVVPTGWDLFRYGSLVLVPVVFTSCVTAWLQTRTW